MSCITVVTELIILLVFLFAIFPEYEIMYLLVNMAICPPLRHRIDIFYLLGKNDTINVDSLVKKLISSGSLFKNIKHWT